MGREAFQMRLVNDRLLERDVGRGVPLPVEHIVDHDRLRDRGGVVPGVERKILVLCIQVIGEQQVVFVHALPGQRFRVRIDQKLLLVEPQTLGGTVLSPHLVCVELSRLEPGNKNVPDILRPALDLDDVRGPAARAVKEEEEHFLRVFRIKREVHASRHKRCAQRIIPARRDRSARSMHEKIVSHSNLRLVSQEQRLCPRPIPPFSSLPLAAVPTRLSAEVEASPSRQKISFMASDFHVGGISAYMTYYAVLSPFSHVPISRF
jgi:hypothetical protein